MPEVPAVPAPPTAVQEDTSTVVLPGRDDEVLTEPGIEPAEPVTPPAGNAVPPPSGPAPPPASSAPPAASAPPAGSSPAPAAPLPVQPGHAAPVDPGADVLPSAPATP
jgi:hypothetical protein